MIYQLLPIVTVLSSFLAGVIIFALREEQRAIRVTINIASALFKMLTIGLMMLGTARGADFRVEYEMLDGLSLALHADSFSLLFASLSAILWLLTTIYAIGYLEDSPNRKRFFGFFSFCVCATTGIAFSANLFTFLVFYELLTITTYPLVVHRGSEKAIRAGRTYLIYTISAGAVILFAIVWLRSLVGPVDFVVGGLLHHLGMEEHGQARIIFLLLVGGFGVKAALVPLHGWLPQAMVAPAPVSALLHAVAVVKAGAFGIVRVVYDVFGIEFCNQLGVLVPLGAVASVTILYGSMVAVFQDDLKRRLAFSTVSQVSYIMLGAAVFGPLATIGGIVHIVHQALMKITLFFAAGNFAETLHVYRVSQLNGIGTRMPWTMTAFTVGALGMIGVPPMAGFISKWYIAQGAIDANQPWIVGVLLGSTVLNAMYFLPIIYRGWFLPPDEPWPDSPASKRWESRLSLLAPSLVTASLTILVGLLASIPFSPLVWAEFIMMQEYR